MSDLWGPHEPPYRRGESPTLDHRFAALLEDHEEVWRRYVRLDKVTMVTALVVSYNIKVDPADRAFYHGTVTFQLNTPDTRPITLNLLEFLTSYSPIDRKSAWERLAGV